MSARRPLLVLGDLLWFIQAYPLLWVVRASPAFFLRAMAVAMNHLYPLVRLHSGRLAARRMKEWLLLPENEARPLARSYLRHSLESLYVETSLLTGRDWFAPPVVQFAGRENLDHALQNRRGVILLSVHQRSRRQAIAALRACSHSVLFLRTNSQRARFGRLFADWIVPRNERMSATLFPDSVAAQDPNCTLRMLARLREGGIVLIVGDVPRSPSAVAVTFLNHRRSISTGALDLARLCRCPVLPFTAASDEAGLRIEFGKPLEVGPDAAANVATLTAELERQVKANPAQWEMWTDF